ncbi:BBE domain-containing protein [Variovorax sp. YR216]
MSSNDGRPSSSRFTCRDNFGPHYDKLASINRKCDPGNLFHMNQNIQP